MALTLADLRAEKHLERRRRQVVVVQAPELDEREGGGRFGQIYPALGAWLQIRD